MSDDPKIVQRANTHLSGVLGHYTQIEIKRGSGCYLYDFKDTPYLDFSSGVAVCSTGHCHPKVVKAIQDQAAQLIHGCIGVVYYDPPIRLIERLSQILGDPFNCAFLTQSGTEAIEACIKLAKYVTGKTKMVAFKGGFHGRSLGALSVTSSKEKFRQGYGPLLPGVLFCDYPNLYHHGGTPSDALSDYLNRLDQFFETQVDDDVAACIIEPVLGEGGYVFAPQAFLQKLQDHCNKRGILLIFDEIQSGFGRSGSWFLFQELGIMPDIVAMAKGMGSGMPIGACMASKAVMDRWTTGAHGGTYGGNPVASAAALATIDVLSDALPMVSKLGAHALNRLKTELHAVPVIGDIRGKGLLIGIEFVHDNAADRPNPEAMKQVMAACLDQHLITICCGVRDNVLRICPPLTIDQATLDKGLSILISVIHGLYQR